VGVTQSHHNGTDEVGQAVERVRARLAEMRESGLLPALPEGELDRQFQAVVETVEAGLLAEPPVDPGPLHEASNFSVARISSASSVPGGSLMHRVVGKAIRRAVSGVLEQVGEYAKVTTRAIEELADRQRRMQDLMVGAHLDRLRALEYRVAQLELELSRARDEADDA
jgi:hypothetical protein